MGSDVSRVRFDALRDHAAVVMQQGRVLLDADWNELVDIIARRLRANAVDLGSTGPRDGIAGVAVVPRTTPDAFLVEADDGDLTIGLGRMYVDGLVAENHGSPADGFDALLDGRVGDAPVSYAAQPYWPTPDPLPSSGTHLVYLDVWEREVTPLEAPDLVEQALGVDTTTRRQVVWQVRLLPVEDGTTVTCTTPDEDVPGWSSLIAPSAGRLTTGTVPVDDDVDACELPPTGGYRGPENQTYRVEVHTGGAAGTATFKWSRDNASVASRVVEVVSPTRVRPASLGKDGVLRFRTGDWVEITDDHRELDQQPGVLRLVTVHEDGTVTFDDALPTGLQLSTTDAAARNLRMRRWDQAGRVLFDDGTLHEDLDLTGTGAITVPAGGESVVLERGVTVTLTAAGGEFHSGDHWIFVARTADTSVEELVEAPPLGTHHHHARLAVVDLPDDEDDCRVLWPPEPADVTPVDSCGDCTVCVTPVSHATGTLTIQDAVDQVREQGGTVCLARGRYQLTSPVDLTGARSVRVTGTGPSTLLAVRDSAFVVDRAVAVTIEDLAVLGGAAAPLVDARATVGLTLQRLALVNAAALAGAAGGDLADAGGAASAAARLRMSGVGARAPAVALSRVALRPQLRDNLLVAPVGVAGAHRRADDEAVGNLLTIAGDVADNLMLCELAGVHAVGAVAFLGGTRVHDNLVMRGRAAGIATVGLLAPGAQVVIEDNTLHVDGVGIAVGTGAYTVRGNSVDGPTDPVRAGATGIAVAAPLTVQPVGPTRILDNHLRELSGAGIEVAAPVAHLDVRGNHVHRAGHGIRMVGAARADAVVVAHNHVVDVGADEEAEAAGPAVGIRVQGATTATVEGNVLDGIGTARPAADGATGIAVLACRQSHVAGNTVRRVGPIDDPPPARGVHVGALYERLRVSGNDVRRVEGEVDEAPATTWTGILVGVAAEAAAGAAATAEVTGKRGWLLTDEAAFVLDARGDAIVEANHATGSLEAPAMDVRARGDVTITGNQLTQPRDTGTPALHGGARTASVTGNRAVGGDPSVDLDVSPERVAVVANLTSGGIVVAGTSLGAPWDALNPGGI